MRFSQRIGKTPVKTILQVESIDEDLKNRLWNLILEDFFPLLSNQSVSDDSDRAFVCKYIWKEFYGNRVDEIPSSYNSTVSISGIIEFIKNWYFTEANWAEVYDFIEFIDLFDLNLRLGFTEKCNRALKKEISGYRLINGIIVQITSEEEIESIEEALDSSDIYKSIFTHLNTAIKLLADKNSPNYRNSIKEAVSAVEALCKIVVQDEKATLGKALAIIEKKHNLHPSLKEAYGKIYGYASDADGIRHALLDDGMPIEFEDAKFMLVSCSAFINYLKAKIRI